MDDLVQNFEHHVWIAKLKFKPTRLLLRDDAFFVTLDRKGNRRATSDGIHAELVTDLVGMRNGREIIDPAIGTQGAKRFIFGTAIARINFVWTLTNFHHALTFH